MPDNFQDYSYLSHPSPSGSSDSHSSNGDATSTTSSGVGFAEWTRDYNLDALYSPEFIAEMTEEEIMECLANIPVEGLLPEPQTIHPRLLQGFPPAQNVRNAASSSLRPMMMAQPNLANVPRPSFNTAGTWPAGQTQHFFPSPQQVPPSSRRATSLHPAVPTSPGSQVSSVGPPGDSQRLPLPAPGDMNNCSSCEVIM
ncbi:unnamed protein product [Rhizoctonia solani]|uniref:Uncharacterized protein n=1 Tax=Rhizoctonia solani TaxID=456999 RepID=A0A8H3HL14_9AGAM|nr:unnamed protein product [Rhizoctonia solani]